MTKDGARRRILNHIGIESSNDWSPMKVRKILNELATSKIIEEPAGDWKDLVFWSSKACLVSVSDVMGRGQKDEHCMARNLVYNELHVYWGWSQGEIGKLFNKHRTTINSGLKRLNGDIDAKWHEAIEARDRFYKYIGKYEIK